MHAIKLEITLPDLTKQTVNAVYLCENLAIWFDEKSRTFSLTHVPTGAKYIHFEVSEEPKIYSEELRKITKFFETYKTKIETYLGNELKLTNISLINKNKKLRAFHKLLTQLKKRVKAIGIEMLVGSFYRDEADFQKSCAKFFKETVTYSDDALLSPQVITECMMGIAKIED